MQPLDFAKKTAFPRKDEALPPHTGAFAHAAYAFQNNSVMLAHGCTQVTHTSELGQMGRFTLRLSDKEDRRHLCRRASRAFWPLAWLPLSLHAHSSSKQKKSSWSSSPYLKSRFTPVSTSNSDSELRGQAFGPVPSPRAGLNAPRRGMIRADLTPGQSIPTANHVANRVAGRGPGVMPNRRADAAGKSCPLKAGAPC